ncbi:hypothetical protein [Butyrivibrio fibrisolvens]|uniref:hypothetical protein n=1 Tax=Butyrivibrio fibrisolvens TaxID=831 RepID=UPI0003B49923|nr:hypothetical protein [Butyrivibrio fibrisolvens]
MYFEPVEVSLDENCLSDLIRRYHFNDNDKKDIVRLYKLLYPRVHAIFHYVIEKGSIYVIASLGRGIDSLQDSFLKKGDIQKAYIIDCLGIQLLEKVYEGIDDRIHELTGMYVGDYTFVGDERLPLQTMPDIMRKLGQKKIRYNNAYVLTPKKSVLFKAGLSKDKVHKSDMCSMCGNKDCANRSCQV